MGTRLDDRGRLYFSREQRAKYGEMFHVVEYRDHVELIPIDEDPLKGLREAIGDAFEGKSVEELKAEARELARREAEKDVRRD